MALDQLLAMRVFVRIADSGSFAKAADSLELPRSSVSKLLLDLEQHLGTKLVERSTRASSITPEGEVYRERAIQLLAELDEMDASVASARTSPRGRLRIDIGSSLANLVLIPALPEFTARYPEIELLLGVNDRPVDLIGDGVDCVIRGGELPDSSLVARRLCTLRLLTCATPGYLASRGTPVHPEDLETSHTVIRYFFPQTGKSLPLEFSKDGQRHQVTTRSAINVSESTSQIQAVLAGLGLAQVFSFGVREQLASGQLLELFSDWDQPAHPLHLVYPSARHPSAKLRAFADWATELFSRQMRPAI